MSGMKALAALMSVTAASLRFFRSDARNGREGRALAGRIDGEAGVVLRQVDVRDEGVGRLDVGDGGELEFLRQPVLQRPERPFRSASGKGRREGRPSLDGLCGE